MNGASKILTVSYGTFSCTLEGFDEPFNTMKAIAEYFRDLAADDRYFGAEPPTPDAAMLHKIAEREIQRRVEAKVSDNGVLLRADDAPTPRVTMPAPSLAPAAAPAVESAASRLSRLRSAQTQTLAPVLGDISSRFHDIEAYAEDQDATAPVFLSEPPAPQPEIAVAPIAAPQPTVHIAETPAPQVEPAPDLPTIVAAAQVIAVAEPEPTDAIIVQDQATTTPAPAAEPADAEPQGAAPDADLPQDLPPTTQADDAILAAVAGSVLAQEPAIATAPFPESDEIALASLRESLAGMLGQDEQLAVDMAEQASAVPDLTAPDLDTLPQDQAGLMDDVAFDDPTYDDLTADELTTNEPTVNATIFDDAPLAAADGDLADLARMDGIPDEPTPEPDLAPTAETLTQPPVVAEKLQRARARVIKIRRQDKAPDLLTPEAEADLQSTLAALQAEIAPPDALSVEAQLDAELAPTPTDKPEARIAATDDAAVDRLLAATNTQFEVPEVKRRRSAIAHLKAAVLATVADRRNNPDAATKGTEVKMDPYRKDLDQAVRPIAATDRPAPLVLVSEQRIDRVRDAAADALRPVPQIVPSIAAPQQQPVRPRRVTNVGLTQSQPIAADDDATTDILIADSDKQSFAEFAETLGAENLAELIEAAGAYCTLVLDRPSFSRPLLFQQMSSLPHLAEMSREDGLRGFGKLLRDGRIQKTERGQFALSTTSPILTEARRIAS